MPLSALREAEADYVVDLASMGTLLGRLATDDGEHECTEVEGPKMEPRLTDLTCPVCRGTIWEIPRGSGREYRCRVGHAFSPKTMLSEHFAVQEKALYCAIFALEEGASLAKRLADQFESPVGERLREGRRSGRSTLRQCGAS